MIIGTGSDLVDVRRIEKTLERFSERFTLRVFTETERFKSDSRRERAASYAKRFAAKEACAKALGTGIARGVFWRDMGVVNLPGGQPSLELTGGAALRLSRMLPEGHEPRLHLSVTDDFPMAQAFVIIEAIPSEWLWEGVFGDRLVDSEAKSSFRSEANLSHGLRRSKGGSGRGFISARRERESQ